MRNRTNITRRYNPGLTLIELLITLSIIAALTIATIPALHSMIAKQRISTQTYTLVTDINLTRSEAIKRGHTVTLCKSADGQQCEKNIDWNNGWLIFADTNGNKNREATEKIIRRQDKTSDYIQITNGRNNVAYKASGRLSSQNGSFRIIDKAGKVKTRKIVISRGGRVRTEYGT